MIKVPCYKCDKRHINCHSKCKDYAEYRAEIDKNKHKDRGEIEATAVIVEAIKRQREYINAKNRGR